MYFVYAITTRPGGKGEMSLPSTDDVWIKKKTTTYYTNPHQPKDESCYGVYQRMTNAKENRN